MPLLPRSFMNQLPCHSIQKTFDGGMGRQGSNSWVVMACSAGCKPNGNEGLEGSHVGCSAGTRQNRLGAAWNAMLGARLPKACPHIPPHNICCLLEEAQSIVMPLGT